MARPRSLADDIVLDAVLRIWLTEGERAVTFARVAERAGLSRAALAGRYGDRPGMLRAAGLNGWDRMDASFAGVRDLDKSATTLLRALDGDLAARLCALSLADPALRDRADGWRQGVEAELALRLGRGERAREAAQGLFAAWQGQAMWGGEMRLKEVARRLA